MDDVLWRERDRYFDSNGDRISRAHEALEGVIPACVVGHGLQDEAGNARCKVLLLGDCDVREVECPGAG